jgi:hypothetical protein
MNYQYYFICKEQNVRKLPDMRRKYNTKLDDYLTGTARRLFTPL